MALIQIFSTTGIEIEYKKDSLTLKKENNSLSSDFKVPHSSFPFLVIENDITKNVLGPSDITSIRKNKIVPVIILENGIKYYGELQQLSVVSKFRKCNLKYGSDIIPIVNKKIADFLPTISVIPGETDPVPFSEESTEVITGNEYWETFPVSMIGQIYPDVKFNFPTIYWLNKYGVGLDDADTWFAYQNHLNKFKINEFNEIFFILNEGNSTNSVTNVLNKNVAVPHLFLLSPLHYIFSSLGWKISGNFTTHELIKRLILIPKKDNLCKTIFYPESIEVIFTGNWSSNRKTETLTTLNVNSYIFKYKFTLSNSALTAVRFVVRSLLGTFVLSETAFIKNNAISGEIIEGEIEFRIDSAQYSLEVSYFSSLELMPLDYEIKIRVKGQDKELYFFHPTIELGRYAPDWTVGNYLNYIKNQFNLDITLDDFKKEITLNLNEEVVLNEVPAIISQSLSMKSYDIASNSSFVLKYENDEDAALFITQEEVIPYTNQDDDFTKLIESKFKILPRNGYTSVLSEEIQDKEGFGLVIYDESTAPFTAENTESGFNLSIPGEKGIYETFFRRWLKFLLNASNCEVTGYFTETEISKINKAKAVYINNQRFRIIDIETTEASNNYQEVKMRLLSVNY
jgi:hypothetical protein